MKKYNTDAIMKKVKRNRPKVLAEAKKQMNDQKTVEAQKIALQGHKALTQAAKTEAKVAKDQLKAHEDKKKQAVVKAQRTKAKNKGRRSQAKK